MSNFPLQQTEKYTGFNSDIGFDFNTYNKQSENINNFKVQNNINHISNSPSVKSISYSQRSNQEPKKKEIDLLVK